MITLKREIAEAVLERAQDHCEACGWPALELALHHRLLRSRGGNDDDFVTETAAIANIMAVHPRCHDWIHANPAEAELYGWMVASWALPTEVPVQVVSSDRR